MAALTRLSRRWALLVGRFRLMDRMRRLTITGVAIAVVALAAVAALIHMQTSPAPADVDFGQPVAGQHVYDRTGLLSSQNITLLNERATEIARSGVPVVVYLQTDATGSRDAVADGRALMRTWGVETSPGAADGIVLFFNVNPNSTHGPGVALLAGDRLKERRLPAFETRRIVEGSLDEVSGAPVNADSLTAMILASLNATDRRLRLGVPAEPERSVIAESASAFARIPMTMLSGVIVLIALGSIAAIWRGRPRPLEVGGPQLARDRISPVLSLALSRNQVDAPVVLAAVHRLASQGALETSVPAHSTTWPSSGTLRLLDRDRADDAVDRAAWDRLAMMANADHVVDVHGMALVAHQPGILEAVIAHELERRGWWDATASRRHGPLVLMSQALLAASGAALVVVLVAGEAWGAISIGLLLGAAFVAWQVAHRYPRATPLGLSVIQAASAGN